MDTWWVHSEAFSLSVVERAYSQFAPTSQILAPEMRGLLESETKAAHYGP